MVMSRTEAAKLWLAPFVGKSTHDAHARKLPFLRAGEPTAKRLATDNSDQLHHFVAAGRRIPAPHSRSGRSYRYKTPRIVGRYDRYAGNIFPRSCSVASR